MRILGRIKIFRIRSDNLDPTVECVDFSDHLRRLTDFVNSRMNF